MITCRKEFTGADWSVGAWRRQLAPFLFLLPDHRLRQCPFVHQSRRLPTFSVLHRIPLCPSPAGCFKALLGRVGRFLKTKQLKRFAFIDNSRVSVRARETAPSISCKQLTPIHKAPVRQLVFGSWAKKCPANLLFLCPFVFFATPTPYRLSPTRVQTPLSATISTLTVTTIQCRRESAKWIEVGFRFYFIIFLLFSQL